LSFNIPESAAGISLIPDPFLMLTAFLTPCPAAGKERAHRGQEQNQEADAFPSAGVWGADSRMYSFLCNHILLASKIYIETKTKINSKKWFFILFHVLSQLSNRPRVQGPNGSNLDSEMLRNLLVRPSLKVVKIYKRLILWGKFVEAHANMQADLPVHEGLLRVILVAGSTLIIQTRIVFVQEVPLLEFQFFSNIIKGFPPPKEGKPG